MYRVVENFVFLKGDLVEVKDGKLVQRKHFPNVGTREVVIAVKVESLGDAEEEVGTEGTAAVNEAAAAEVDETEADAAEVDETEADATEVDETEVDATEADAAEVDETEADATEVDETEVDETEADAAEVDETEADATEVDETEVDETEVDETEVDETEVDETEVDETEVDETEVDETEVDECVKHCFGKSKPIDIPCQKPICKCAGEEERPSMENMYENMKKLSGFAHDHGDSRSIFGDLPVPITHVTYSQRNNLDKDSFRQKCLSLQF